jgi:hypothetical protein
MAYGWRLKPTVESARQRKSDPPIVLAKNNLFLPWQSIGLVWILTDLVEFYFLMMQFTRPNSCPVHVRHLTPRF